MQILALGLVLAGMTSRTPAAEVREADLESRVGQPADIAASAYLYRCDRPADENPPEIWLLLAQHAGLPLDKPVDAGAPAVKRVLCGLLWEEPRPIERVELTWPKDAKAVPRPEDVVVRWLPHGNSSSWWSRRAAGPGPLSVVTAESPQVAGDGRTYVYTLNATGPTTAADNLVVALKDGVNPPAEPFAAPTVRVITPEPWKLVEFEIEWGFQDATQNLAFDGRIEAYNGVLGAAAPLPGDTATTMTGDSAWQSKPAAEKGTGPICRNGPEGASHKLDLSPFPPPAGNTRRGIRVSMLYLGTTQNTTVWRQQARVEDANRTIVTVRTGSGSFSFLPADLQTGPILAPEFGFFVRALRERQAAPPASGTREVPAPQNLLTEKVDAIAGGPGVRGWGSNDTPWFGANPAREPVTVSTFTLPARSTAMHPGPTRNVAVGWRSPMQGRVSVRANVSGADTHGGNGVDWQITLQGKSGPQLLAAGSIEQSRSQAIPADAEAEKLTGLAVEPGDLVSLVLGPKGDHTCDTTVVELVIAEAGEKGRTWDLTHDVADSVQAGNPHADSLGNAAVWHFYAPEGGLQPDCVPVVLASQATSAREFLNELAARNLKTIRQRVREHEEQTWEGAMEAMHPGGNWPPYPQPEFEPAAQIDVPDRRLTDAWRSGAWHLLRVLNKDAQGRYIMRDYPYDALAHESFLIIRALDLQGMHQAAADGLARWLDRGREVTSVGWTSRSVPTDAFLGTDLEVHPTSNSDKQPLHIDGLFSDTLGALSGVEWDWQHAGGPGVMHWQMVEHYLLTGDRDWLARAAPKLRANADWMIRQRHAYAAGVPGRERLWTHGLLPPHNIWDSTNWRPWYETNANYCFGLARYAEAIADVDPEAGRKYAAEARAYAADILAAADKSFVLSPAIRVRDGTYRSFLPPAPYMRGPASRSMPTSFGSPEHTPGLYPDAIRGGIHLVNLSGLLSPTDPRAQGMLDVMEDRLLLEHHRLPMRTPGYDPEKHWFSHAGWYYQCGIERTANVHLQWDDVPNFLRSFYNEYAVDIVVGPYTFNEHTTRGPPDKSFEEAAFLDRLRAMLVMEDGQTLWLARATPRAWLAQGKRIAVKDMPTHFGPLAYEIVSDVDHGRIRATVEMPSRRPPKQVLLRLRHPKAAAIKSVAVNGQAWKDFDAAKEVVRLHDLQGRVAVEVEYAQGN